jgi:hypothetical protein
MGTTNLGRLLLVSAAGVSALAPTLQAASFSLGAGIGNYHNHNTGWVLPFSFAPRTERYEFGVTLIDRQNMGPLGGGGGPLKVDLAPTQVIATFSRRWVLQRDHRVQPVLGFGVAYFSGHPCPGKPALPPPAPPYNEPDTCNYLLGSRLNFTEQFGLRLPLDARRHWDLEASWRHFSNGGLNQLNRGQNALQIELRRQLPLK